MTASNRHGIQELFQQIMAMSQEASVSAAGRRKESPEAFHLQELTRLTESTVVWCIRVWKVLMQHEAALQYFGKDANAFHVPYLAGLHGGY